MLLRLSATSVFISKLASAYPTLLDIDTSHVGSAQDLLSHFVADTAFIASFYQHGCWCAKLDPSRTHYDGLGGSTPSDELDEICKRWIQTRKCTRQAGGSCAGVDLVSSMLERDTYTVDYVYGLQDAICPDGEDCRSHLCQIDLEYVRQVAEFKQSNPAFSANTSPSCAHPVQGAGGPSTYCATLTTTPLPVTTLAYCSCSNGVGHVGATCPSMGEEKCISCNAGYHLKSDFTCEEDFCWCGSGYGSFGTACLAGNGNEWCSGCYDGFYLESGKCIMNECTCANGVNAVSSMCPSDGSAFCVSCDSGYELVGNACEVITTVAPTTTRFVVPGFALSFNGNWGYPENQAPGGVSSDTATGLSYSPADGSFVPTDSPTQYTLNTIDIDMTIEKAHSCSDHVVVLKTGAGKPLFDWSAAADEVVIAWDCNWPMMHCGSTNEYYSPSGDFSTYRDYEWDLKMDASGVSMYIDGVLLATCSPQTWYGNPYYIWIGSDNDPGEAEGGVSAYGNYRSVQISNVVTRRFGGEVPVANSTVPHKTSNRN